MTPFWIKREKVGLPNDVCIIWSVGDTFADTLLYSEIVLFSPFVVRYPSCVSLRGASCFVKKERFFFTRQWRCVKKKPFSLHVRDDV